MSGIERERVITIERESNQEKKQKNDTKNKKMRLRANSFNERDKYWKN